MNKKINKIVEIQDLGTLDYKEAWDYQEDLLAENVAIKIENRKNDISHDYQIETFNKLIFCQHPHVYTLGKSGKDDHLLLSENLLDSIKAKFYRINRGGDITYHGPGQLVVYPIFDLENFFTDIHLYLRKLEEVVINVCESFGLESGRIDGLTGVWINPNSDQAAKICAMGVKTSRWVTMHGLALNVNTDLSYFDHIVPCGIQDKSVTSLQRELGKEIDIHQVKKLLTQAFASVFNLVLD